MELGQVAEIFIGILVNREITNTEGYAYSLFQFANQEQNKEQYQKIKTKKCFDHKLTQKDDIIFRLVYPNKMLYVDETLENLLVPSQMCIIRTNKEKIDSGFLIWYLSSDLCKEQLQLNVAGSSIQKISVNALRKIILPNISLEKQKQIRQLIELWKKEKKVLNDIMINKEKLYNCIAQEILEENDNRKENLSDSE